MGIGKGEVARSDQNQQESVGLMDILIIKGSCVQRR